MPPSVTAPWSPASCTSWRRRRRFCRLKSFHADGSANLSDILRAIYYAASNNANVINMSFNLTSPSQELGSAVNYAYEQEHSLRGFFR